jgi:hypothetical protein
MNLVCAVLFQLVSLIDTTEKITVLNEVLVRNQSIRSNFSSMPASKNGIIYSGKKTELIQLTNSPVTL